MHDQLKALLLRLLKVPPEPEPAAGLPSSIRVFRASRNFYTLKLLKWGLTQTGGLIGIIAIFVFDVLSGFPPRFAFVVRVLEFVGLIGWAIQLPVTFFLVRLDYEMRWYIVTDRSLRIRHGIQSVREITMTFANIQQITLHQGPLQRLLGISDLQVRTAGGGGTDSSSAGAGHHGQSESMHLGFFRGVDNAAEIRDLILERLRLWRDAGLGDPDDVVEDEPAGAPAGCEIVRAAQELLAEAKALRGTFKS